MNLTQCEEAYDYNANPYIVLVFCVVCVLNVMGIVLTLHVTRLLLSSQVEVFHINLRILFGNLSICLCIRSALTLYRAARHLYVVISWTSHCDFLQSAKMCTLQSELNAAPVFVLVFAYLIIAIERCIATIMYKTYEKRRDVLLSIIIALLSWVHPVVTMAIAIHGNTSTGERPYCSSMTAKAFNFTEVFVLPIVVLVISTMMYSAVWRFCVIKQRLTLSTQQHNLSGRFQLGENIRASKIVIPNAFLFIVVTLVNIAVLGIMNIIPNLSNNLKLFGILKELSSLTFPIYINLYAWIFILGCSSLAKRTWFIRRFQRFTTEARQNEGPYTSNHFNMLTNYWK
uniref:G_PROTEIN_RECEP_F1_2 domain-containing protein n=1 Tax=Steinernema glaseri TaxID=37863 RepID=A0A1I8ASC9_9BILA